jgi:hypothetical protein
VPSSRARIVVCIPAAFPPLFPDDELALCVLCSRAVRFRPHIPDRRALVCLVCFLVHAEPGAPCELQCESLQELRALSIDQIQAIAEAGIEQLREMVLEEMPVKGSPC